MIHALFRYVFSFQIVVAQILSAFGNRRPIFPIANIVGWTLLAIRETATETFAT